MKRLIILTILVLVVFLVGCTKALEKGLTETREEFEEIEQESESIQSDIDNLILQDCCDACTYNYGEDPLPDETLCVDVINQYRDSIYNVREDESLNNCIELFEANPKTIATCK